MTRYIISAFAVIAVIASCDFPKGSVGDSPIMMELSSAIPESCLFVTGMEADSRKILKMNADVFPDSDGCFSSDSFWPFMSCYGPLSMFASNCPFGLDARGLYLECVSGNDVLCGNVDRLQTGAVNKISLEHVMSYAVEGSLIAPSGYEVRDCHLSIGIPGSGRYYVWERTYETSSDLWESDFHGAVFIPGEYRVRADYLLCNEYSSVPVSLSASLAFRQGVCCCVDFIFPGPESDVLEFKIRPLDWDSSIKVEEVFSSKSIK